jgi:hypothetical protein
MNGKFDELICTVNSLVTRVEHVEQRLPPQWPRQVPPEGEEDEEYDDDDADARNEDHLRHNHHGMGGNRNRANNDPFAKTKFIMIPFADNADPEAYLDWELAVEQKFNSHLVPAEHRVRLATSEFTGFALFWWNNLCTTLNNAVP